MATSSTRRPDTCLIGDFHYRNWIFLLLTLVRPTLTITPSPSLPPTVPPPPSICDHLLSHYRFSYTLNLHIPTRHTKPDVYQHYIVARPSLLHFSVPSQVLLTPEPLARPTLLTSIPHNLAFTLWPAKHLELTSRLCFHEQSTGTLTCLTLDHYGNTDTLSGNRTFSEDQTTTKFTFPPSFYPTVAYQDVTFTEEDNSRFTVIFLAQTAVLKANSTTEYRYERRFEAYSFQSLSRIAHLTGLVIPEYLETVPEELELTGAFNWRNRHTGKHEYLLLAFDGSQHVYCADRACSRLSGYKPYLSECKPEVTPGSGQAPLRAILPANGRQGGVSFAEQYDQYRSSTVYTYPVYLLSAIFFLLICLGLLLLGVCYYSVKEVRLQEAQVQKAIQKSILLGEIADLEEGRRGTAREAPMTPNSPLTGKVPLTVSLTNGKAKPSLTPPPPQVNGKVASAV